MQRCKLQLALAIVLGRFYSLQHIAISNWAPDFFAHCLQFVTLLDQLSQPVDLAINKVGKQNKIGHEKVCHPENSFHLTE